MLFLELFAAASWHNNFWRSKLVWRKRSKLPHLVFEAGTGFFANQVPLAYRKKSSPGFTERSILAGSINFLFFLPGGTALNRAIPIIMSKNNPNIFLICDLIIYVLKYSIGLYRPFFVQRSLL